LKKLENEKLMDSTIVILTADHGQEFNDNKKGYWQHGGNYSKYQIKVPMILYDASKLSKAYNTLSLHYDIVPTLMNSYLGVTSPMNEYSMGLNLFNLKPRNWFVSGYTNNYAIIEKDRITKIYATGFYDITDLNLNNIEDAELHYDLLYDAMVGLNVFYAKEKLGTN
ncbi:MAG: sulfatase-like hydrolase/transferase, partial [Lutibacter sp.]|nr:sulfatase-like hydrolase/transferase [Lutibacter sp.]